ncbi:MAG TPA: cytochrome c oxidase subunit II [Vicinamibacterales bacterium]|jgi:cytochrome c oxidase subunit 2|nr:cytochrome c oxidase subunit II [Vicinamibacterales bacterium]
MFTNFPFFPQQASEQAATVDALYFFLVAVSAFFAVLIALLIVVFAVKFHRKDDSQVGEAIHGSLALELLWTLIPLGITMVMFVWGAQVFFHMTRPPKGAMEIYVVGKQWMWKVQHMDGAREINELHVPTGRPVKLIMGSEDVIHSFFIPDFRVKADVIPGRYNTLWFTATKAGRYHLFCTQYCGTKHSAMIGWVTAMEPADYQTWLSGGAGGGTMAENGAKLFQDLACATCHLENGQGRGPVLKGAYGHQVLLQSGQTVTMDDAYIRESILTPQAKIVAGFTPIMPTFQGLVTEEQLLQLIAYVKSLGESTGTGAASTAPPPGPVQKQR